MNQAETGKQSFKQRFNLSFKRFLRGRSAFLLGFILLCFLIMSLWMQSGGFSYQVGEIADEDIYYTGGNISYESALRTENARNAAAAAVGQVFAVDDSVAANMNTLVDGYRQAFVDAIENMYNVEVNTLADLRAALPGTYSDDALYALLYLSESQLTERFNVLKDAITTTYLPGVESSEIEAARQSIAISITSSALTANEQLFFKSLLEGMELTFNKAYDAAATRAAQDAAMAEITPVVVRLQSGERLVSRGSSITAEQLEALEAAGLAGETKNFGSYMGLLLLVGSVCLLIFLYVRQYQPRIYQKPSSLLILAAVFSVTLLLCKLISLINISSGEGSSTLYGYLMPVSAAALLLTVLLDRNIAIVVTVGLSVFIGVIMNGELAYVATALLGGITATLTAARLNQRSQFVFSSLWIILANLAVVISFSLIWRSSYRMMAVGCLMAVINGLLSSILAMGLLPFLESVFSVTTMVRLLELSNSNNPLLKRLMVEAPGTYNHSILVGNLAEAAADAIGADALLVRVASYYHDIGKLKRPQFYIENQRPGENPHDKLQPALSAKIITSHPVDGIKMLKEARFPQEILDIVEQHHGNGTLSFFYNKALETALDPEEVKVEDFSYGGRLPQTREAALVMLADSVQAGVQALQSNDIGALEQRVNSIINEKIALHQLQESPLTFRDLEIIENSFMTVLSGMNHIRINYKNQEELESPKQDNESEALADEL